MCSQLQSKPDAQGPNPPAPVEMISKMMGAIKAKAVEASVHLSQFR